MFYAQHQMLIGYSRNGQRMRSDQLEIPARYLASQSQQNHAALVQIEHTRQLLGIPQASTVSDGWEDFIASIELAFAPAMDEFIESFDEIY